LGHRKFRLACSRPSAFIFTHVTREGGALMRRLQLFLLTLALTSSTAGRADDRPRKSIGVIDLGMVAGGGASGGAINNAGIVVGSTVGPRAVNWRVSGKHQ
jgi:hypothetical protein